MMIGKEGIMDVKIEDNNKDEILRGLDGWAMRVALEEVGLTAERYAKRLCPVDTGRLRNSITHQVHVNEKAVHVGTNVEYAPYVELGTKRQKAQPYLKPAITNHISEYREIFNRVLGDT